MAQSSQISSDLRREADSSLVSTWMGDHPEVQASPPPFYLQSLLYADAQRPQAAYETAKNSLGDTHHNQSSGAFARATAVKLPDALPIKNNAAKCSVTSRERRVSG